MRLGLATRAPDRDRISRAVLAGLVLLVAVWLGYAFGRGQSLADIAYLYREQDTLSYTIQNGSFIALFERTGGDLKPVLRAPDGTPLIDYSDWDYNSVVIADGDRYEFVRLIPQSSVDYQRYRLVEGLSNQDWELAREVTLKGGEAEVAFTFLAKTRVHEVHISISHDNWYWLRLTPRPDGFVAEVPHATRDEVEAGLVKTPAYELTLRAITPGPPTADLVRINLAKPYGVESVGTQYHLIDPPVGQYVPVAREVITWRKL